MVLAAGRGVRLGSLTADRPKPLVEVGGRPCLEWVLSGLAAAGVTEAVVVTGYRAEAIESRIGSGASLGLRVRYARQQVPDGTGSAVLRAREAVGSRCFAATFGDVVLDPVNYALALRRFRETRADLLMAVNWVDDPCAGAAITVDEGGWVTSVVEKPAPGTSSTHWNHAGLIVARPLLFDYLAALSPSPRGEYELTAAYPPMLAEGLRLLAMPVEGHWGDIGTPEELERMDALLREQRENGSETRGAPDAAPAPPGSPRGEEGRPAR